MLSVTRFMIRTCNAIVVLSVIISWTCYGVVFSYSRSRFYCSISEQSETLAQQKNILQNYDSMMDKFLAWLSEKENASDLLQIEVDTQNPMRSPSWPRRSKVSRTFIRGNETKSLCWVIVV